MQQRGAQQSKTTIELWQAFEAKIMELEWKLQEIESLGKNDLLALPPPNTSKADAYT